MKKSSFSLCVTVLIFLFSAYAQADWQLYDDFNSGEIDPKKWEIDDSSATITVENGRLKFVHKEGYSGDSSWLSVTQNPEAVKGLKATITIESCTGDVISRIAGFIGKSGEDHIWSALIISPDRQYISSSLPVLGPGYVFKNDFFWGHFRNDLSALGSPYTLSMILKLDRAVFAVDNQGELEFVFPRKLTPDDPFKGIGTRSDSGNGTCTVYFDDVYIYSQSVSPAVNILLLEE